MNIKLRYIGEDTVLMFTNNKIYNCIGIERDLVRVIDDEDDDYLYSMLRPKPYDNSTEGGIWELVEDTIDSLFQKSIENNIEKAKGNGYDFLRDKERIINKYKNKL